MDTIPPTTQPISGISAVFPAFNDGGTISSMVLTALMALRKLTDNFEIIVTDDGSSDYTGMLLDEMAVRYPELRVIHHRGNLGYGAALRSGFSAATKEWIFYTDGDAQYNPLELVTLASALTQGVDIVNGYKITRSDPFERKIIGRIYHYIVKWTFGFHLRDVDCDFRLSGGKFSTRSTGKAQLERSRWNWSRRFRMPVIYSPKYQSTITFGNMANPNFSTADDC